MADPKTLKFQFVVDEASLQKTRQVIRELTTDLTKLNEAAGKFGGGGGAGGLGGVNIFGGGAKSPEAQRVIAKTPAIGRQLVQGFLDQKQIFKGISDGSKDSMRVMTESLHRAINSQKQDLKSLEASAKSLVATYDSLTQKVNRFKSDPAARGKMGWAREASDAVSARQQAAIDLQKNLSDQQKARGELESLEGMAPQPQAKQGLLRRMWAGGFLDKVGLGGIAKKAGPLGTAAVGLQTISGFANGIQTAAMAPALYHAQRNQVVEGMVNGMAGGDLSYGLAAIQASRDNNIFGNALHHNAGAAGTLGGIVGGIKKAAGSILTGNIGAGGMAITPEGIDVAKFQNLGKTLETYRAAQSPFTRMALAGFQGDLGSRIQYQRLLGGGGVHFENGPGGSPINGHYVDAFGDLKAKLQAEGYSPGEFMSSYASMRGQAGRKFAGKMAYANMAAQAAGYSGFGEVSAAGARAGGGTALGYGAIGGSIDKSAGIQLGQTIIGSGFDRMGTTTGLGLLSAVQQGVGFNGTSADFNQVQRVGAGMGLLNGITTGGLDPYQKGRNLVSAIDRLGPGASTYAQDYLGNGMNFRQMIDMAAGGKMTATASALGLTRGDIKGQLSDSVGSVFDRFVDEGKGDPMSKAIRSYRKSGKSLDGYLGGLKGKARSSAVQQLGAYYGIETGEGEEAGLGAMGVLAGMDKASINRITKGKGLGGGVKGIEKTDLESMSKIQEKVNEQLKKLGNDLSDSAKMGSYLATAMEKASKSEGDASAQLVQSIDMLRMTLETLTASAQGRPLPDFTRSGGGYGYVLNAIGVNSSGVKLGPGAVKAGAPTKGGKK